VVFWGYVYFILPDAELHAVEQWNVQGSASLPPLDGAYSKPPDKEIGLLHPIPTHLGLFTRRMMQNSDNGGL
jgi:hypothetical protein